MKKSNWKKALSLGLALLMTVSFAACSNAKGNDPNNPKGKGDNATTASDPSLAKQYVFRYKEVGGLDQNTSVVASRVDGEGIEMLTQTYIWDEYGEEQILELLTMKLDGSDLKKTKMELKNQVDHAELDSSEGADDGARLESEMEDYDYYNDNYEYENSWYGNCCLTKDGVYAIRNYNKYSSQGGVEENINETYLCSWNKDGSPAYETKFDLTKYQNDNSYSYISRMVSIGDTLGLIMAGDQSGLIQVSKDGTIGDLTKLSLERDVFSHDATMAEKDDGTFLVAYYNDDWSKQFICTYDPATGKLGEEYQIPEKAQYNGFYEFAAGKSTDVVYSNSEGLFGFNLGDTEVKKIMDYVNSDLSTYGLSSLYFIDDEHFIASFNETVNYENVMALFTYVKPEDIPDKKVLSLAGVYIDSDVKRNVINFNKKSNEYRIILSDYGQYNTYDDYTMGTTKFNNDMIAGNVPDIIYVNGNLDLNTLISKHVLANIDERIKNDPELSSIEFMDNVFEAYRVDGVLYQVIPKFIVRTWIAKKSLVGDRSSWTMAEVKEVAGRLNGDKNIFGGEYIRESFLDLVMSYCGNDFVDLKTGKCDFDNQLFVDFLEYARTLPSDWQEKGYDDEYWDHYYENYQSQYRENRTLMQECFIGDPSNLKYQVKGLMGDAVAYIGFPSEKGNGSFIQLNNSYAISAKSSYQDGAWEFVRFFLTEDYQRNENYQYGYADGMSVYKSLAREAVNKITQKPYWTDENGKKVEYDDTFWFGGESVIMEPFTQAEADELFNFICSVSKPSYYDENVSKIVYEEAEAFFAGSKSAKDVAGMVQNRVQLYVNENR